MAMSENAEEELQSLECIYFEELTYVDPSEISSRDGLEKCVKILQLDLKPHTAQDESKQFVRATLLIGILPKYPEVAPIIRFKNVRGMADEDITQRLRKLYDLADSRKGEVMLYDMIEWVKETLTEKNIPAEHCSVCLCAFADESEIVKTSCFHYFHPACLASYITHCVAHPPEEKGVEMPAESRRPSIARTTVPCPVCRSDV
eukprot:Colp12_sorted_trinity150504_noHs@26193